ncbi:MAG: hypothetical protein RR461_01415 [Angelakisella sp.]
MKRFIEWIGSAKAYASLVFTGEVLIYTAIKNMLLGETALPYSMIWQFLALAVIIPFLQMLCFGDMVFKNLRSSLRLLLFSLKLLCTLSIFAGIFHWFPVHDPMAWIVFVVGILAAESILGLSLHLYFRITGQQYTEKLKLYKEHHRA